MKACWLNGSLVDPNLASVSVFDHGLLYGDGAFEGIRFYDKVPFRLNAHLQRLERSARALTLEIRYSRAELTSAVGETVVAAGDRDGYIRLVATRGIGTLGVDPRSCRVGTVFILADKLELADQAVYRNGARVILAATRRLGADEIDPRIKSLNYLNQILARIEANQAGADEAIMLNRAGMVVEGTADNVFVVANNRLLTPPLSDGALDGITRQVVFELADRLAIPFGEESLAPYDLYNADECFLTGTGAELIPVVEVQGRRIGRGEHAIFERLRSAYSELIKEETTLDLCSKDATVLC